MKIKRTSLEEIVEKGIKILAIFFQENIIDKVNSKDLEKRIREILGDTGFLKFSRKININSKTRKKQLKVIIFFLDSSAIIDARKLIELTKRISEIQIPYGNGSRKLIYGVDYFIFTGKVSEYERECFKIKIRE